MIILFALLTGIDWAGELIEKMVKKAYNLDYLLEISGGDEIFVHRMIREFMSLAPESLDSIRQQINNKDYLKVRMLIHQFGPQLDYLGLSGSRLMADQIESLCKTQGDWNIIISLLKEIDHATKEALQELANDFKS
jgi:HPt (histidine-containing phosphotransfer) domain-containing protein